MNRDHALLWIDALRSGKYKKGRGSLYAQGRYCALGVLDVVTSGAPRTLRNVSQYGIMVRNNERNYDFNRMADHIEQNWESL